jgi:DNA-binding PadR family transcriptional regulator
MPAARAEMILSELEGAVLAMVWREGPVTPYALRKMARESRSPHLSASAGSIYPLVERLEARGLVDGEAFIQGRREGTAYRITRAGLTELRAWIAMPGSAVASGAIVDPARTRLTMLSALPPRKRREVIADLIRALEDDLEDVSAARSRFESLDDPFALAAWRGDLLVQRARLKWLREVEKQMLR